MRKNKYASPVFDAIGYEKTPTSQQTLGWDTSSIEGMERTARAEADHDCSLKIRDRWLEVEYIPEHDAFIYKWGNNVVSRTTAENVHATR